MDRKMTEEEHKEWLARNRHLLDFGTILAFGGELTHEEWVKFEEWWAKSKESKSDSGF